MSPEEFGKCFLRRCIEDQVTESHLKHLREEPSSDLLTGEVIYTSKAGHGAAQGPVRGRPDAVGPVDAVHRRLQRSLLLRLNPRRLQLHLWRRRRRRRVKDVGCVRTLKSSPFTVYISHVCSKATERRLNVAAVTQALHFTALQDPGQSSFSKRRRSSCCSSGASCRVTEEQSGVS